MERMADARKNFRVQSNFLGVHGVHSKKYAPWGAKNCLVGVQFLGNGFSVCIVFHALWQIAKHSVHFLNHMANDGFSYRLEDRPANGYLIGQIT